MVKLTLTMFLVFVIWPLVFDSLKIIVQLLLTLTRGLNKYLSGNETWYIKIFLGICSTSINTNSWDD